MAVVAKDGNLQIDKLTLGPFGTNSYIITCRPSGESVVVDAPGEVDEIIKGLKGTHPRFILITHAHMDHIGALSQLKSDLEVPIAVHPLDAKGLPLRPEMLLDDGSTVSFGRIRLSVLHTPGHTPGSVCFLTGKYLISGDTLFPGGPGKTGSPADLRQIIESIKGKILPLPDDTQVYPGHGDPTVLRKEREEFALFSSRPHDPNLCGDVLWLSS
jgi:glyoxylase-like metal-dependent hydrolase (beta-lactamase superfamily II)